MVIEAVTPESIKSVVPFILNLNTSEVDKDKIIWPTASPLVPGNEIILPGISELFTNKFIEELFVSVALAEKVI